MAHHAAPDKQQHNPNQNERQAQACPQSKSAPAAPKTQPSSKRQADNPVSREMTKHGRARVSRAAESARRHGLDTIKELKRCSSGQQQHGAVDDSFIGSVDARNPSRDKQ